MNLKKINTIIVSMLTIIVASILPHLVHAKNQEVYIPQIGEREILRLDELDIPVAPVSRLRSFGMTPSFATLATSSVPILHSFPSAPVKFYLNFVGQPNPAWGGTSTPIDTDGDTSTFTDAERTLIHDIWARVAEKFAPFNVDITTEPLTTLVHGQNLEVIITNDYDWASGCGCGGQSYIGSFNINTFLPNVSYVFPTALQNNAKYVAEASAHEIGHQLGLRHQSRYNVNGAMTQAYNSGNALIAPIMGSSYASARGLWWNGPTDISVNDIQDDIAIITGSENGFGYRAQDKGQSSSTATQLPIINNIASTSGIVSTINDADYFSFVTSGGTTTLAINVASSGPMFRSVMEIRNASDVLVAQSASTTVFNQSLSLNLLGGTYYLIVKGDSTYGDVGQYFVSGTVPQTTYTVIATSSNIMFGTATSTSSNNYGYSSLSTFVATPASGYVFSHWAGNIPTTTQAITATSNPLVISTYDNHNITAHFALAYMLSVTSDHGNVAISIPSTYASTSIMYASGTPITLIATPDLGYTFKSWNGSATSTSNTIVITMDSMKSLVATYEQIPVVQSFFSGGGGGSGGGGSYSSPTSPQVVAQPVDPQILSVQGTNIPPVQAISVTNDPGCTGGNKFSTQTGQVCSPQQGQIATNSGGNFIPLITLTQNLQLGSSGAEVTKLQQFLIGQRLLGGQQTGYYDASTRIAVMAFQRFNGIDQTGTIGPKTRQKIAQITTPVAGVQNEIIGSTVNTLFISPNEGIVITQNLNIGSRGAQVLILQKFMINKGLLPGQATGYFGVQTAAAVSEFQRSRGIEATGTIGPKTRAALIN